MMTRTNSSVSHTLELTTEGRSFASYGLVSPKGSFDFDKISPVPEELPDFLSKDEEKLIFLYQEGNLYTDSLIWEEKANFLLSLYSKYHSFSKEEWRSLNGRESTFQVYTGRNVVTFQTRQSNPLSTVLFLKRLGALCKDACFHYIADFSEESYFECEIRRGKLFYPVYYRAKDKRDAYLEQEIKKAYKTETIPKEVQ